MVSRPVPQIPLQTHLAFLPSLLASWPPGRRAGSELEYLRFRGRPGPRRAGLRELSSLLGATERMLNLKAHPPPHSPLEGITLQSNVAVSSALRVMAVRWKPGSTRFLLPKIWSSKWVALFPALP